MFLLDHFKKGNAGFQSRGGSENFLRRDRDPVSSFLKDLAKGNRSRKIFSDEK